MPRDLFGDVVTPSSDVGNRKWYAVPLSLLGHLTVLAPVVLVTMVAPDFLPIPQSSIVLIAAPEPPAPPPPPVRAAAKTPERPPDTNAAPIEMPDAITPDSGIDYPHRDVVEAPGVEPGVPGGAEISAVTPEPPPTPDPPKPVRPGGIIKRPEKLREVLPVYPPIAQAARVQGIVIIEALIAVDGRVQDARVLRSIPLLDQAALDAVRQWTYTPTQLNGVAVPVIMTVTVQFTLSQEEQ